MTDRVAGPRLKVGRAKRHIDELVPLVSGFLASNPYEAIEEVDPETGQNRARVKIHAEPDPAWALIIGDAVHNLRSALDLLYWQLLIVHGTTPKRSDIFPIRDSKTLFDKDAGPVAKKRAGRKTFEKLRDDIKPYKGANNALWRLHQLDIIDKHRLVLVVASANPAIIVYIGDEAGTEVLSSSYLTTTSWPLKDGDELPAATRIGGASSGPAAPKMEMKFKNAFAVTLYEPSAIELPEPLAVSLANMTAAVEQTIAAFAPLL